MMPLAQPPFTRGVKAGLAGVIAGGVYAVRSFALAINCWRFADILGEGALADPRSVFD